MARKNGVRRSSTPLPAFDEWVRPWKDDEFDAEKAAKLIYDLHSDKETLFKQIDESDNKLKEITDERDDLEDEVDTLKATKTTKDAGAATDDDKIANAVKAALEAAGIGKPKSRKEQRAEAEAAAAKNSKGDDDDLRADRLEIAMEKGLTKAQALRLKGSTREELESDADAYIEEHGLSGEGAASTGGQAPPSQRPQTKPRTGAVRKQTQEMDADANLSPGELAKKYMQTA